MLEVQASADRSAVRSAIEGRNCMQGECVTTLVKLQVVKGTLFATFDHVKRHSSNVWAAGDAVPEPLKSNWRIDIQTVFDQG